MNPTGSYLRFHNDLLDRYSDYEDSDFVTFGILIADPRQTAAREFIFNYLNVFDRESGDYFDFFIPGYTEVEWHDDAQRVGIRIKEKEYFFSQKLFDDFWLNLERNYNFEYTFNPMLILMSMQLGRINTAEYIILELDDTDNNGIQRSGMLFRRIFRLARTNTQLNDFQTMFHRTYVKGNWLNTIVNAIGQDWLIEINRTCGELKRFKIRHQ